MALLLECITANDDIPFPALSYNSEDVTRYPFENHELTHNNLSPPPFLPQRGKIFLMLSGLHGFACEKSFHLQHTITYHGRVMLGRKLHTSQETFKQTCLSGQHCFWMPYSIIQGQLPRSHTMIVSTLSDCFLHYCALLTEQ